MIFHHLDFHIHSDQKGPKQRQFRLAINPIIDSIYLHMPKGLQTERFSKLNVVITNWQNWKRKVRYWDLERVACVEYFDSNAAECLSLSQNAAIKFVKSYLRRGIREAAKHDLAFANHLALIRQLINSSHKPFDYRTGVTCSDRREKLKAELAIRIQPDRYLWKVQITRGEEIREVSIRETETLFPYFSRLREHNLQWAAGRILLIDPDGKTLFKRNVEFH